MLTVCEAAVVQAVVMEAVGVTHGVVTVKLVLLVAVPFGVVTEMVPVVAPAGTVNTMVVELVTLKITGVPLSITEVAPVKLVPVIVTVVPIGPLAGLKEVMVGNAGVAQLNVADQPLPLILLLLLVNLKVSWPPVAVEVIAAGIEEPVKVANSGDAVLGPLYTYRKSAAFSILKLLKVTRTLEPAVAGVTVWVRFRFGL